MQLKLLRNATQIRHKCKPKLKNNPYATTAKTSPNFNPLPNNSPPSFTIRSDQFLQLSVVVVAAAAVMYPSICHRSQETDQVLPDLRKPISNRSPESSWSETRLTIGEHRTFRFPVTGGDYLFLSPIFQIRVFVKTVPLYY
ncbi:hypothetical protein L1887_39992 [Cichorium endivia]|nr:hypothetical protein L1887_39992 [Cichorium endivia]